MHGFLFFQPALVSSAFCEDVAATETDALRGAAVSAVATTSTNISTAEVSASHSQGLTSTVELSAKRFKCLLKRTTMLDSPH